MQQYPFLQLINETFKYFVETLYEINMKKYTKVTPHTQTVLYVLNGKCVIFFI